MGRAVYSLTLMILSLSFAVDAMHAAWYAGLQEAS